MTYNWCLVIFFFKKNTLILLTANSPFFLSSCPQEYEEFIKIHMNICIINHFIDLFIRNFAKLKMIFVKHDLLHELISQVMNEIKGGHS